MKILRLRIRNINSLRLDTQIDFEQAPLNFSGLFAITGDTGAGKTTLLDAITLGLYGKLHRNKDVKEVMSYGATESLAEVEFESRGTLFRAKWTIWRARQKPDGNMLGPKRELAKWNEVTQGFDIIAEKIKDVDEKVEEVSGLDYDRFCRSVLLSQGDFAAFLKASEKDRSELLERITGTEIYSQLSKAAYQKHKLEQEALNGIKQKVEGLNLLSPEEYAQLEEALKEEQVVSQALANQLKDIQQKIQWRENLIQLSSRKQTLENEHHLLQHRWEEKQDLFAALDRHQQTLQFQSELTRLDDLTKRLKQLSQQISTQQEALQNYQTEEKAIDQQLQQQNSGLTQKREEQEKKQPLFDQVVALDIEIREKKLPIVKQQEEYDQLQQEHQLQQQRIAELYLTIEQNQSQLTQLNQWLEENQELRKLGEEFSSINLIANEITQFDLQIDQVRNSHHKLKEQLQQKKLQIQQTEKKHQAQQEKVNELIEHFSIDISPNIPKDRSEQIGYLYQEIESLQQKSQGLEQLFQLNSEYTKLMNEFQEFESKLDNLQQEELFLNKDLLSSLEEIDRLKELVTYKQHMFEREQLIANYEKDRSNLKPGDPCPLCFSEDHPFRAKQFKPFVDQSRKELEKANKKYDQAYLQHKRLLNRQNELEIQLEQLRGNELKSLKGQVDLQMERITLQEERILTFGKKRADFKSVQLQDSWLKRQLELVQKEIRQKRTKRTKLEQLDREIKEEELLLNRWNEKFQQEQMEEQLLDQKVLNLLHQLTDMEERKKATADKLESSLTPFQSFISGLPLPKAIAKLKELVKTFKTRKEQREELDRAVALNQKEVEQRKEVEKKQVAQLSLSEQAVSTLTEALSGLEQQRQQLFGDRDPLEEREQLAKGVQVLEATVSVLKNELNEIRAKRQTAEQLIFEKQSGLQELSDNQKAILEQLDSQLRETSFESIEELKGAVLSNTKAREIKVLREDLKEQLNRNLTLNQELTKEKEQAEMLALTEESLESLKEIHIQLDQRNQGVQRSIGGMMTQLKRQEELKASFTQLMEALEKQHKELARWAKLNEIIGTADGKKFRVFAQGLTLKKLIELANLHLEKLNGRYVIEKKANQDLALEIIDLYQANNRRSMHTLSGGESFLVSLALALGLSDLAGRSTQIRSLFIDEGFGTLDENTLDLAITTLENLQSSGKTIGIISHVKALKERISTQIQLHKKGNGFSEIELVG